MKKLPWIYTIVIVVCCAAIGGLWLVLISTGASRTPLATEASALPDRRDFSLIDTAGHKVSLATYRGKWLMIFFGFTNCPEACPLALTNISSTLKDMGSSAKDVQPIFITVDPERDTPSVLKSYISNFSDAIAGLSGTDAETAAVAKAYGVYTQKVPIEGGGYTIDHSTGIYWVSPEGGLIRVYEANDEPSDFAHKLIEAMASDKGEER